MDQTRFDTLTKVLAGSSRRTLLAAVGAAYLAALVGPDDPEQVLATSKRGKHRDRKRAGRAVRVSGKGKKKPCPPCKKRKQGKCKANQPDGTACENGGQCQSGSCQSASPLTVPPPPPPEPPCTPTCAASNGCGDDGCGGSCGTCGPCKTCQGGICSNAANDTTCAGGLCQNGACVSCGALNQLCCSTFFGRSCGGGWRCRADVTCGTCGGLNQSCCWGGISPPFCDGTRECSNANVCVASCGGRFEPCCSFATGACDDGSGCIGGIGGFCP